LIRKLIAELEKYKEAIDEIKKDFAYIFKELKKNLWKKNYLKNKNNLDIQISLIYSFLLKINLG
tara:strand:- start:948 stop:1139 length:192 start_codon:yes stop_codon:yes gene_type:complete